MTYTDYNSIYQKVIDIIAEILAIDKSTIKPETTFDSLGVDSLDKLNIIMKFEETFNIEISDNDVASLETVAQAVEKIQSKIK